MPSVMPEKFKTKHSKHGKHRSADGSSSKAMKAFDVFSKNKRQANQKRPRSEDKVDAEKVEANTKRLKTAHFTPIAPASESETTLSLGSTDGDMIETATKPAVVTVNELGEKKKKNKNKNNPVLFQERVSAFKTVMDKTTTQTSGEELASVTNSETLGPLDTALSNIATASKADAAVGVLVIELEAAIAKYRRTISSTSMDSKDDVKIDDGVEGKAKDCLDIDNALPKTSGKKIKNALNNPGPKSADKVVRKTAVQVSSKTSEQNNNKCATSEEDTDGDDDSSEESSDESDST